MCQGYIPGVHHFDEALAAGLDEDIDCGEFGPTRPMRDEIMTSFSERVAETPGVGETEALDGLMRRAAETFPFD